MCSGVYYRCDDAVQLLDYRGIALGFISYCVMKIGTGRLRTLALA